MTIGNAKQFIKRCMQEKDLRNRVRRASDDASLQAVLAREGLVFSDQDFDEAFHNLLTQCQYREQADLLKEFRMFWEMTVSLARR